MYSSVHVCMYAGVHSCLHAVTPASLHTGKQMLRQSGITNKKKDIFPKETEKGKKKKKAIK
ncbi:hypothetical protein [Flavobacterium chungbukense]|uniref:hypothetical protein n=1 Tax=Flavobacterium chungbukense TaxID=877464 RepID=UPI001E48B9D4|nr:hypothetical protein [Flavobacterium chungbukense]MCC4921583.1 hypothetical protein [Flavobacterium chungbukense]